VRVHVVSDVHGAADALARAGEGADALICLGDLVLFVDYDDPGGGIFAELFGPDNARRLISLRTAKRFDDARTFSAALWAQLPGERAEVIEQAVDRQYAALFAAMPTPAYVTYGNVDVPALFRRHAAEHDGVTVLDGEVVDIGGRSVGFVGGGLRTAYRTPNEIDDDEYAAKVAAVAGADVICAHIPPALPDLLYDTVARRMERGSEALLDMVRRTQPRLVLHGHVHQPLVARTRIGRTECVNVGHFRGRRTAYGLDWGPRMRA
jgi:Icc-related predicted phosphoesterase